MIQLRLLFNNAPWITVRERISQALQDRPPCGGIHTQNDRLVQVVFEAVNTLTPSTVWMHARGARVEKVLN